MGILWEGTLADGVFRERPNVRQLVLSGKARQPWVAGLILLENWVWARREREGLELEGGGGVPVPGTYDHL